MFFGLLIFLIFILANPLFYPQKSIDSKSAWSAGFLDGVCVIFFLVYILQKARDKNELREKRINL
jgi:hypothetical protein